MNLQPPTRASDHSLGPSNAPVELVEFGDYECPYCRTAHAIVKALIAEFGDGLRYVFRNYPLESIHPDAMNAALVAESASGAQFWALHDLIYTHQDAIDEASLVGYARKAGVPDAKVRAALEGSTRAKVEADMASGDASGIRGTPTFFIDGKRYDADWSEPALRQALQRAMAR